MSLDTSRKRSNEGSVDFYGDADYNADKGNKSATQVLAEINADPSKMGNGGVTGPLYARIKADAARENSAQSSSSSSSSSYRPKPSQTYESPGTPGKETPAVRAEALERARIRSNYDENDGGTGENMKELFDLKDAAESDWRLSQAMFAGENDPSRKAMDLFNEFSGSASLASKLDNRIGKYSQYYKDKSDVTFGETFGDLENRDPINWESEEPMDKIDVYKGSKLNLEQ